MADRPTLNYTTTIDAGRTVLEMQRMLAEYGASAIGVEYADRQPVGLTFTLLTPHGLRTFQLPVHADRVLAVLRQQARDRVGEMAKPSVARRTCTPEQAQRIAWRVLKDWLAAQLALIQAAVVSVDQVMLPYLLVDGRTTLYERYREHELRAIGGSDA